MHEQRKAEITSPIVSLADDGARLWPMAGVFGLVCLGVAAAVSFIFYSPGLQHFSYAYLTNFCFFASIALGALFFVTVQHLTRAGWSVTVRRIAEIIAVSIFPMLILFLPILIPILIGYDGLYVWNQEGWTTRYTGHLLQSFEDLKGAYLSRGFFGLRTVVYFAIWGFMAWYFFKNSLAQDKTGDKKLTLKMQAFSAPMMLVFAFTLVFASFDWEMSLEPMWFSTMFPVYFFAGAVMSSCAMIALIGLLLQRSGRLTDEITVDHYHDLAKLMFAFVVFWGYIAFSQFMLYWYANIPEETFWYGYRFGNMNWRVVTILLAIGHLIIPLLGIMARSVRRNKKFLMGATIYLLAMHWVDHYWLVMPQLGLQGSDTAVFHLPVVEVLCLLGMSGLFVSIFCFIAADKPLVPLRDPRLGESLNFKNA